MIAGKQRRAVTAAAIAAALLAGTFVLAGLLQWNSTPAPGTAEGDGPEIRLEYVVPTYGDLLRDAAGDITGETPGFDLPRYFTLDDFPVLRTFVFTAPAGADVTLGNACCTRSGLQIGLPRAQYRDRRFKRPSGDLLLTTLWFAATYETPTDGKQPIEGLSAERTSAPEAGDLSIRYWCGPRGEAEYTFEGPFEAGRTLTGGGSVSCTLTAEHYYGNRRRRGTLLYVDGFAAGWNKAAVLAYDARGQRHAARYHADMAFAKAYLVQGLAMRDIAFVTVNEESRERLFRNVRLRYGTEEPDRTRYIFELDLRVDGRRRSYSFEGREAVDAADLLSWGDIPAAANALLEKAGGIDFAALDEADRARLLNAARRWALAMDPRISASGVAVGLQLAPDEFEARAAALLQSDEGSIRATAARALARAASLLSRKALETVAAVIAQGEYPELQPNLVECLLSAAPGPADDLLLKLARDERPWVSLPLLRLDRIVATIAGDRSRTEVAARLAVARGFEDGDAAARAEAVSMLPDLLCEPLALADADVFKAVLDALIEHHPEDAVVETIFGFLREVRHFESAAEGIAAAVAALNRLFGIDISRVGGGVDLFALERYKWHQVVDEAVRWRRTGLIGDEGYQVKPADLRIVLVNETGPEESDIAVLSHNGSLSRPRLVVKSGGERIFLEAHPAAAAGRMGANRGFTVVAESPNDHQVATLLPDELPHRLFEGPLWISIEAAESRRSAISGTKVFEQWWEKYGPEEAVSPETHAPETAAP